jgi:TolA-binding protein
MLNKESINNYIKGDAKVRNKMERATFDDDFESEALDGWALEGADLKSIESIKKKLYPKKLGAITFSLVFIAFVISLLFVFSRNQQNAKSNLHAINNKDQIQSQNNLNENRVKVNQTKQLTEPKQIKKDFRAQRKINHMVSIDNNLQKLEETSIEKLPLKEIEPIKTGLKPTNKAKETYLLDFKVLDYRYYRSKPLDKKIDVLNGTPADQESKNNMEIEPKYAVEVSYFNFLEKSLHYFEKKKYSEAASRFKEILQTYPDDVNALFYGALCYYNSGEFFESEKLLLRLEVNKYSNFEEESQWYLCLTYKSLEKKSQYTKLKEQIILKNGFYSKKARDLKD